jgi:HKD family nuclease
MLKSLIGKYCPDYPELLRSKLYTEETFYKAFIADLNKCNSEVLIESPFMTTRRISMLLPTLAKLRKRGVLITICTRDPEEGDSMRLDSHKALSMLLHEGIHVVFTEKLHRKLAILDGTKLWEGSLNILSQNNSREIMRRSKSEQMANQVRSFIDLS